MTVTSESPLFYATANRSYRGLLLRGDSVPKAAAILLPDWRGQSPLAREHAQALLDLDCVIAIADLYGDGFSPDRPEQVGEMVKALVEHRDHGVAALSACAAALRAQFGAELPMFCLGYSAGGMVALDYGRSGAELAGIVVCSALLKTASAGQSTRIVAPVLILHGTQDVIAPMDTIAAVVAEMDAAGNDFRLVLYGQTHHAFDNPDAGTDPTSRLVHSPAAAAHARTAIARFVDEHTHR